MIVEYHIEVDLGTGNATVTRKPAFARLTRGDIVHFTSNDPDTMVRYISSTPFEVPELAAGKELKVGRGKGPFICVKEGEHKFECGRLFRGEFSRWGRTEGDITPVDPGGSH
jgi:hypothetical protein